MTLAAANNNTTIMDKFNSSLPENQRRVVLFDTEQGAYHVQKVSKRVNLLAQTDLNHLDVFGLRKFTPAERLNMIESYIYNNEDLGFVVIDGIRDLITSINDEEQATIISSKLLKWTEERNIHIICVLHQNKGDNNARGHIGTELVNKAETVLSVTKKNKISTVKPEFCRDIEPEEFSFMINDEGLPEIANTANIQEANKKLAFTPDSVSETVHADILSSIYQTANSFIYKDLYKSIKDEFAKRGNNFGDNKAKVFLKYYEENNLISKIGKSYSLMI